MANENKYPKEIFTAFNQNAGKTLSVTADFSWQDDKPMMMTNLSRVVFSIIDHPAGGGTKVLISNIPAAEIPGLYDFYREVMIRESIKPLVSKPKEMPTKPENRAICDKLKGRFTMGRNKGKMFYEVNIEELVGYRDFLQKGADEYPNNKKIINDINEILNYPDRDKCLNFMRKVEAAPSIEDEVVIYECVLKPRRSQKKENGKTMCYTLKITYNPQMRYPWGIEVRNLYCTVEVKANGQINTHPQDAEDDYRSGFRLSDADGRRLINTMMMTLDNFRTVTYKKQYEISRKMVLDNIANSKTEN